MNTRQNTVTVSPYLFSCFILALLLTACGGSGGSSSTSYTNGNTSTAGTSSSASSISTAPALTLTADCSGTNCGSSGTNTYSGSGVGAWYYHNDTTNSVTGAVNLSGVSNKSVTLIWTNTSGTATTSAPSSSYVIGKQYSEATEAQRARLEAENTQVRENLPQLLASNPARTYQALIAPSAYVVGNSVSWYDSANARTVYTTLRSQGTLSNGNKVNIWVQNSEWNAAGGSYKITQSMADLLRDKFATSGSGIYDMATALAGSAPWGTTSSSIYISASQDIQIVVSNLTPDKLPSGLLGYFNSLNNFLKSAGSAYTHSNQALMFFVDSETLASPSNSSTYQATIVSALAHEFVHMINFYQRTVLKSTSTQTIAFDTWLEEISAMMMQDILDPKLDSSYRTLDKTWFPGWVGTGASSNCSLVEYVTSGDCFSYEVGGSYAGYLLRQYGLNFYHDLLQSSEVDSITALDGAIKKYDASGSFAQSVRRWGGAIALLDSSTLPSGYGYPQRSQSFSGFSYTMPALNGPDFANSRVLATLPSSLKPYAHGVQSFKSSSSFSKTVTVPAGVTLTVVVN